MALSAALLQAISWLAIAFLPESSTSIAILSFFLLLGNLGASIAEVANDAIVAEAGKQSQYPSGSGQLQSFVWMAAASAGVLGNLLGGIAIDHISPRTMFAFFGLLLVLQFFITGSIPERSLNLPKKKGQSSNSSDFRKQSSEILFALRKPEIFLFNPLVLCIICNSPSPCWHNVLLSDRTSAPGLISHRLLQGFWTGRSADLECGL